MAGSLVSYGGKRSAQCFLLPRTGDSVPRCIHHIRNPWDTLGLGEDQGVEVFQKAWRCFLSAPTSRKLWRCPVQYTVSYRNSRGESNTETGRSGMGGMAPSFQTVKIKEEDRNTKGFSSYCGPVQSTHYETNGTCEAEVWRQKSRCTFGAYYTRVSFSV